MNAALADENFNNAIIRGIWRRNLDADLVRVQDVGLSGADDDSGSAKKLGPHWQEVHVNQPFHPV